MLCCVLPHLPPPHATAVVPAIRVCWSGYIVVQPWFKQPPPALASLFGLDRRRISCELVVCFVSLFFVADVFHVWQIVLLHVAGWLAATGWLAGWLAVRRCDNLLFFMLLP